MSVYVLFRLSKSRGHTTASAEQIPKQDEIQWPKTKPATAIPTPYQIFQQKIGAPYSKRRFYELVKLYHPDKHCHDENGLEKNSLSFEVKMERYRLVVAANEILSHPVKRRAYDEHGAGWNGRPDIRDRRQEWENHGTRHWSGFHDNSSPARNATWEDWEKWYQRNEKGERTPQSPLYVSNEAFISLIAIIACLGGVGQATRIGEQEISYLKRMETIHTDCNQDRQRRMEGAQGYGIRDERVEIFLRTREQAGFANLDASDDNSRRLPPPISTA
ncbi:MAG: hypothetical protein Q9195_000297 [Heterodermia aff. obscurata]